MDRLRSLARQAGGAERQPAAPVARPVGDPGPPRGSGEPRLSLFGVGVSEVLVAVADVLRGGDKEARRHLLPLITRYFLYEELPPDALIQLGAGKDVKLLRSLYCLAEVYVGKGSAGTPTLYDPALAAKRADDPAVAAVLAEAWQLLQQPALDPGLRRATLYLVAAAARASEPVRKQLAAEVQRAIAAADALASAGGGGRGTRRGAATDWVLQHTVFGASRLAGAATGRDEISHSFMVGVGSPDPVGARHALALGAEVAYQDPTYVVRELYEAVAAAGQAYEEAGPGPARGGGGEGVNLEDAFARLHLARLCALVVHSDQAAGDVGRDGAPFWNMLVLLATRDPADMVRFGAMEALTGSVASASAALAPASGAGGGRVPGGGAASSREEQVFRQRRGRAWRLLVAQAGLGMRVPGAAPGAAPQQQQAATIKLVDVLGRLLVLALHKTGSVARLTVACSVIGSLAESCLASQSTGATRHNSSPEVDRVMGILASELGALLEAPLPPSARCAALEALLYLQAAGYGGGLTPAKVLAEGAAAGGSGDGGGGAAMQDALLSAVLRCARAKPRQAATFLGYASAVVGMAPAGLDLGKVTDLWDAAAAAGREGRTAVLAAVLDVTGAAPPPAAAPRPGAPPEGREAEVSRAAREEDGWNAFVATAVWWLGEHANGLCDEFCGRKLPAPPPAAANGSAAAAKGAGPPAAQPLPPVELLALYAGRKPTLSRIVEALHALALTGVWQLRLAAARAMSKIAVRSGEPFRLRCYGLLAALGGAGAGAGGADPLGVQAATKPALALLDAVYSTQAVLEQLWQQHGDDVEGWPTEVVGSLQKRSRDLTLRAERSVCALPADRYALLGQRAVVVLAQGQEEQGSYASFLKDRGLEEEASGLSDRLGSELAASKNRELEEILGSDDGGSSAAFRISGGALSDASASLLDRNREVESLLSGGAGAGGLGGVADAWGFAAVGVGGNAFADGGAGAAAPAAAAASPAGSPTFASMVAAAGGAAAAAASPDATPRLGGAGAEGGAAWFGEPAAAAASSEAEAGGAGAGGIGTGTVVHMFVADYNQPEEMSVFEGDQVEVLEEADGWMLVKDPSGNRGLVPTSYIRLDSLRRPAAAPFAGLAPAPQSPRGGEVGGWGASSSAPVGAAGAGGAAHRRSLSYDYKQQLQTKEDFLDNLLSNYDQTTTAATIPEEYPASFGAPAFPSESSSQFDGGSGTAAAAGYQQQQQQQQQPHRSSSGAEASGAAPWSSGNWGAEAAAAAGSAGGGGAWGRQLESGAASPTAGAAAGSAGSSGGASPLLVRQGSSSSGNPFSPGVIHQRSASQMASSSHRRTLSGGSDWGRDGVPSMPSTPSRVDGPERTIAMAFVGEMDGELSVDPGDRVKVHSEVGGWLRVIRLSDSRSGLVPSWAVGPPAE
eukprot:scaffold2.g7321.t1